jgi:predicted metal-dependent enzyme (double-stranded beta helix superfamily)
MLHRLIEDFRVRGPLERTNAEMARLLAFACERWSPGRPLLSREGAYTRTCAYRDESVEVLLLNWAAGAASALHDHGDQHCWMLVLDGMLQVDDYVRLDAANIAGAARVEARDSRMLAPGGLDLRSGRFDLHRVAATPEARAVSLHVYAGPLRKFLVYDEATRRCEAALGTYDDVLPAYDNLQPR